MSDRLMSSASLPPIPRSADDPTPALVAERLRLCEAACGRALPHLGGAPVPVQEARGNIENMIGYAQVPIGIAGPLLLEGRAGRREVFVPMATTEGAMVASYSRGMRLLSAGGGARARVTRSGLSQHPILVYASLAAAQEAERAVPAWRERFEQILSGLTRHGRLGALETQLIGRRLVLRLVFQTGDAIGINMAARAADLFSRELAAATGARACYVHGQDVEKRANARAMVEGRGREVIAEALIPCEALRSLTRAGPAELVAIWRTYVAGFAQLGTQNWTVQAANGLAAVYLACGQDVAYVVESATGQLDFEVEDDGSLYASVTLPSLLVGTVGGGSGKGTARECLELMGCAGAGGVEAFAETLAATVLAGDLSLLAAFVSSEFVSAHEALGRNRPAPPA